MDDQRQKDQAQGMDEWQARLGWPALRSALVFANARIKCMRHTEAVSDCEHCNFGYIVSWVQRQIDASSLSPGTPEGGTDHGAGLSLQRGTLPPQDEALNAMFRRVSDDANRLTVARRDTMRAKVGDWVRFYRNGQMVIGVVAYRRKDDVLPYFTLSTDHGEVDEDDVLELRPAASREDRKRDPLDEALNSGDGSYRP